MLPLGHNIHCMYSPHFSRLIALSLCGYCQHFPPFLSEVVLPWILHWNNVWTLTLHSLHSMLKMLHNCVLCKSLSCWKINLFYSGFSSRILESGAKKYLRNMLLPPPGFLARMECFCCGVCNTLNCSAWLPKSSVWSHQTLQPRYHVRAWSHNW